MDAAVAGVIGREREFAAVAAFLATRDRPGVLVLEGEAGIGKTTLLRAAIAEARRQDFRVLSSSPATGETQLAFAGLADLLTDVLPLVAGRLPRPQSRALEVALLLDDPGADVAQPRTVLAATLTSLRLLAEETPVLIAVDDLQWLDEASDGALAFAVRRLGAARVWIVASRRADSGGRALAVVDAFRRREDADVTEVDVRPFDLHATRELVRRSLGLALPMDTIAQVHEVSGGNPFYALEVGRALARMPEPPRPGARLPVPDTLHALVRARIDALSEPAREVLAIVAALSDATAVEATAGNEVAIGEAIDAGVLDRDEAGALRFTHPLLASAVEASQSAPARRALHTRLAELVDGEERARHLALGAAGPSVAVAAALDTAAASAASRGAIGTAAELAEEAIRLTPAGHADELDARHVAAAGYEIRHGDTSRARVHLEPLRSTIPSGPGRAAVLLLLARLHEHESLVALELCREAIAEAGPQDKRAAEAHQLAAEMAMLSGNIPAAIADARLACDVAERAGDVAILVESLGTLCHYQTYAGSIEPGLLERAVELEREAARPSNNYSPREILGLRLMYADRLDEARELLEASYARAAELGDELDRGSLLIHLTQLECRAGMYAAADRHARECAISREQAGWGLAGARFATALVGAHLGRIDEARADAEAGEALAAHGGNAVFRALNRWVLGFLELSLGELNAAAAHLAELPEQIDAMGYWNPGVRPVHADAIEARIGAGDLGVEQLIDDLEQRGLALANPWAIGAAARCRGLLLAAQGSIEEAITELERAVLAHEQTPQPLERGRTLLVLGSTLRRAKRRREAREALARALELFDAIGAPLWAEKAAAEIARIPGRGASTATGLTETEQRVAALVSEGLSNKEVAARLSITVRTVESNLSSIYAKLDLRSRTELVRRLAERPGD